MQIDIHSRDSIETLLQEGFPANTAVISFYDAPTERNYKYNFFPQSVDYSGKTERVFKIALHDIAIMEVGEYNLTYETYFPEADDLAQFIYAAKADGLDIICQCEYGQSRSPGCAAAIMEHFEKQGISIFADFRYSPNQMVYHKVFHALEKHSKTGGA